MEVDNSEYIIEEFKLLRAEILHFGNIQNATIGIGLAFIGTLAKIGLDWKESGTEFKYIFLLGIPVVAILTLIIWIGAVLRVVQTSVYIYKNESRMKNSFQLWETWLRKRKNGLIYFDYIAVIALFLGIELISLIYSFNSMKIKLLEVFLAFAIFLFSFITIFLKSYDIIKFVKDNIDQENT